MEGKEGGACLGLAAGWLSGLMGGERFRVLSRSGWLWYCVLKKNISMK